MNFSNTAFLILSGMTVACFFPPPVAAQGMPWMSIEGTFRAHQVPLATVRETLNISSFCRTG